MKALHVTAFFVSALVLTIVANAAETANAPSLGFGCVSYHSDESDLSISICDDFDVDQTDWDAYGSQPRGVLEYDPSFE